MRAALNGLLQRPAFTKASLDEIADGMTPPWLGVWSPHRTPYFGNFDINVLEAALITVGKVRAGVSCRQRPTFD